MHQACHQGQTLVQQVLCGVDARYVVLLGNGTELALEVGGQVNVFPVPVETSKELCAVVAVTADFTDLKKKSAFQ